MKLTGSAFTSFVRDDYTTLPSAAIARCMSR